MKTAGITLVTLGLVFILGAIGGITDVDDPMSSGEVFLATLLGLSLLGPGMVMLHQAKKQVKPEEVASNEPTSDELVEEILHKYPDPKNEGEVRTAFFMLVEKSAQERLYKYPNPKNEDEIRTAFFMLIEKHNGNITLFRFAMETNLPGEIARDFLDRQVKIFNASFDVTDQGDVVYRFPI